MKKFLAFGAVTISSLILAPLTFAHVIVTPATAGIGSTQTFDVSIPAEKDNPTIALKLEIPDGLQEITPTIEPGWNINVVQTGNGQSTKASEIDWTGGSIPSGQRADFTFRAQVPSSPASLKWKAYQTYSDGSVVSWTKNPVPGHEEDDSMTPYSQTMVVNDLTASANPSPTASGPASSPALTFSVIALALSAVALGLQLRKR